MYESFYGLHEKPFSLLPDPSFLYLGGRYNVALSSLEYGVLTQAGFILLTGEPGMGKTTLLRKILENLGHNATVGLITNTNPAFQNLMPWILSAFHLEPRGKEPTELYQEFMDFLLGQRQGGKRVVLVIDEGQNLTASMLEELRLLSNVNTDKFPFFQIILSGQSALRPLIQRPELVQFAQRITVDCHLQPMDQASTAAYIRHRMVIAGGEGDRFTDRACSLIHHLTGGIPRLINQICETALVYGFAEQLSQISEKVVAEAAQDRRDGGILPIAQEIDLAGLLAVVTAEPSVTEPQTALPTYEEKAPNGMSQNGKHSGEVIHDLQEENSPGKTILPSTESLVPSNVPASASPSSTTPENLLDQGIALRKKRKYKDSIRVLQQVSQYSDYEVRSLYEAGLSYREAGRGKEALVVFQKALITSKPSSDEYVSIQYELGKTFQVLGKKSEALECYRQVYETNPEFVDVAHQITRLSGTASAPQTPGPSTPSKMKRPRQLSLWDRILNIVFRRSPVRHKNR